MKAAFCIAVALKRPMALVSLTARALLMALTAAPALAVCPLPATAVPVMMAGPVQAAWWAQPATIAVGQPFALFITLCPADAQLLRVGATMPEHRHGMNYRASLVPLGDGRWRADGLLWHMSGRWELRLDVLAQGAEYRMHQSVQLR